MRMYSYKQLPSIKKHENEPGAIINLVIITVIKIIAITIILITIIITIIIIIHCIKDTASIFKFTPLSL